MRVDTRELRTTGFRTISPIEFECRDGAGHMRYLAVGDIHGCYRALTALAAYVPFQQDDLIITLGDYVNRGPDTCAVLDWLIEYSKKGELVALRGNHEIMMLQARDSDRDFNRWMDCGGDATLRSYSPV